MSMVLTALLWLAASDSERIVWVGHQITRGRRELPVLGDLETRTDTWVIAEVRHPDDRTIEIRERACRVRMAEAAGAQVSISDAQVQKLPEVVVRYTRAANGDGWNATPWRAGWDSDDHDGDGQPGLGVTVEAPLCGGRLHVASTVHSVARAWDAGGALAGQMKVKLAQKILGTEGACLGVLASDTAEQLTGRFAYRPVPAGATCASLERNGWFERPLADARP